MTNAATIGFSHLGLHPAVLDAIGAANYPAPTLIQTLAIPPALGGRDVLGAAPTGTGKTAAFLWPILTTLASGAVPRQPSPYDSPRALILSPTRELAAQIFAAAQRYQGGLCLRIAMIVGGASAKDQAWQLDGGTDLLIATPGRLIESVLAGLVDLSKVRAVVLDEADRLLELGFYTETRRLLRGVHENAQVLLFSATLMPSVEQWAAEVLRDPVRVESAPAATLVREVREFALRLRPTAKHHLLLRLLGAPAAAVDRAGIAARPAPSQERVKKSAAPCGLTLIFVRTRARARQLATFLAAHGVAAEDLHGMRSPAERRAVLARFRAGEVPVLVATDVASRGLDVPAVNLVVNFELPNDPLDYVHRVGRTARMGRAGRALSLVGDHEVPMQRAIEELTGRVLAPFEPPSGFVDKPGLPALPSLSDDQDSLARHGIGHESGGAKLGNRRAAKHKPAQSRKPAKRRRTGKGREIPPVPTKGGPKLKVKRSGEKRRGSRHD